MEGDSTVSDLGILVAASPRLRPQPAAASSAGGQVKQGVLDTSAQLSWGLPLHDTGQDGGYIPRDLGVFSRGPSSRTNLKSTEEKNIL